jgi:hypothetical protein
MKKIVRIQNLNVEVACVNGKMFIPQSEAFRIQNSKRKGRQQDMEKICNFTVKCNIQGRVYHELLLKEDKRESLIACANTIEALGL